MNHEDGSRHKSSHELAPVLQISEVTNTITSLLDLTNLSTEIQESVKKSRWFSVFGGLTYIEVRGKRKLDQSQLVNLIDFDDTLCKTTNWQASENELLANDKDLINIGFNLNSDELKQIYELSKVMIAGSTKREARYVPILHLWLLTRALEFCQQGNNSDNVVKLVSQAANNLAKIALESGEEAVNLLANYINPRIKQLLVENSLKTFIDPDVKASLLTANKIVGEVSDQVVRIVMTRGTIGNILGQVFKVHTSGIIDDLDCVIYTLDLKDEIPALVRTFFSQLEHLPMRIYDDHPSEIVAYEAKIIKSKLENIELILVRHPDGRRRHHPTHKSADIAFGEHVSFTSESSTENHSKVVYEHFLVSKSDQLVD